jgi:hypothetical protein
MLDIKLIRENVKEVAKAMEARNQNINFEQLLD